MPEALFVGRTSEQEVYTSFLGKDTPWILIITGMGGIGKSTLLHRLTDYTLADPAYAQTGVVALDFAHEELRSDPLQLLEQFIAAIDPYCDTQRLDHEREQVFQKNFAQLEALSDERIRAGITESNDPALRELRYQMRALKTDFLYSQLKTIRCERLVIMLDTCEWLSEPEGIEVGRWALNELVPGVRRRMRQQGKACAVVMASRVQLTFDTVNRREIRRLPLTMLSKAEVDQYLGHMGMEDASLRQRVYDVTHGHALCVSIIGDYWKNRAEQDQPFTLSDLPELQVQEFSEIALMRFTNERVLKQLKPPYKELTRYGVLLRTFDLPLLRAIFPELLPESSALSDFNRLIRYPYIESRGNYRYAFHELVREALAEEIHEKEPEAWRRYHKLALDYYEQISPHPPDWYYHLLAYAEQQGMAEWQQAVQAARVSGKRESVAALLQAALDKALSLSPGANAEVAYEQGRFNFFGAQWDEARESYQRALVGFQKVEDYAGQAKTLAAIGDVNNASGKQDEVIENYQHAAILFHQAGDLLAEARCYQAIGDVQSLRYDPDGALKSYEQSRDLFRQAKEGTEEVRVLQVIGDILWNRGDLEEALHNYTQALEPSQGEPDLLLRADTLKRIGDIQQQREDRNAAREAYGQALALYSELKKPSEQAQVRQAIAKLSQPPLESSIPYVSQSPPLQELQPAGRPPAVLYGLEQQLPSPLVKSTRRSPARAILLAVAALVIILSGAGSLILLYNNQIALHNSYATATAQITHSNATAVAVATAAVTSPYPLFTNVLLYDPLTSVNGSSGGGSEWDIGSGCENGASGYQVSIAETGFFQYCLNTNTFGDSAYQAQMTILQGDCGGLIFRYINANNFFLFEVCQNGTYNISEFSMGSENSLYSNFHKSSVIRQGLDQINTVAVIVLEDTINVYVNGTNIDTATSNDLTNRKFSQGQIGLLADDYSSSTSVVFTNVLVWGPAPSTGGKKLKGG